MERVACGTGMGALPGGRSHTGDRLAAMPSEPRSGDLDLVRGALRGRRADERELLERLRCVPRMVARQHERLGRPLGRDEEQDVVQDALVAIWRKLERFDGRVALETWIYPFCVFELLRRLRARHGLPRLLADDLAGSALEPIAPAQPSHLDFEPVLAELDGLPPELSAILRLKHFEDMTFEEVGIRLDLSPNTAKTRYYRGLEALRNKLRVRSTMRAGEGTP